jgi:Na+/H+ antiporter NhaD/arsenite permease-like protein
LSLAYGLLRQYDGWIDLDSEPGRFTRVALYLPMLMHAEASTPGLLALAAGSTVAGNLFILGAASNIIIIQNAERKTGHTLGFVEFARVGVPLTLVNVLVYWIFLA